MIRIDDITIKYGNFTAVKNLTLDINEQSIFGFIGPNGAGKTTTIQALVAILSPDSGQIFINGINTEENPEKIKSVIGFMPDFFGVYHNIKVNEYLSFFAQIFNLPDNDIEDEIDNALKLTNLTGKKYSYTNHLSRGMKQRLYIAKLLVHNPEILILDEPASGLDPHARFELRDILKRLQEEGKTIFISSHILSELADICTQVGIIELGRLKFNGSVEQASKLIKGFKKIVLKILDMENKEKVLNILSSSPLILNITNKENIISFDFRGKDTEYYGLISEFVNRNISFIPVHGKIHQLETAFKELTKGEVI